MSTQNTEYAPTTQKTCSVSGATYDEGSFSDLIHRYIEADGTTVDAVEVEIQARVPEVLAYRAGVLSEFTPHFDTQLRAAALNSPVWQLVERKWNFIGSLVGRLSSSYSEAIFRGMYGLYCSLQAEKGRIHKGTPLHNIGWVDLLRGTDDARRRSVYYMTLALIEDVLFDEAAATRNPAYRVLSEEHGLSAARLARTISGVKEFRTRAGEEACRRPELIYLDYVLDRKNAERSNLYDLDERLATDLFTKVSNATTAAEKGKTLELLVAYLFLTSPGFEVIRDVRGPDQQIDLLVRNLGGKDSLLTELGTYVLAECRNVAERVDAKALRDFGTKVLQAGCNSGILVSREGITAGEGREGARLAILKLQQRHDIVVVPITLGQVEQVVRKEVTLADVLVSEYEKIRFDIQE